MVNFGTSVLQGREHVRTLSLREAHALVRDGLAAAGASAVSANATAEALVAAEADGQAGHGLARAPSYAAQLKAGKIRGQATAVLTDARAATVRVDAGGGLAYPALDLAVTALIPMARSAGVAAAGLSRSHHIGQAGRTAERLAWSGLVALVMSNTPKAMAFWGGRRPMMGTNPLAFAAPLPGRAPLVIDLALSQVARSKIVAAKDAGEALPEGWAQDGDGRPARDPAAALAGALLPAGGAKGAALALMVEVLCAALAGGRFGWEASSFLDADGEAPAVGQLILALDPGAFSGPDFGPRMGQIAAAFQDEAGVRLPGDRRLELRARAAEEGLRVSAATHRSLLGLVADAGP